jgi:hypothetical protein
MFKTLSISIAATLVSFAAGLSAQTTEPADSFKVDYFSIPEVLGPDAPDGTVRITNVGTNIGAGNPSGDMFAVIYVFDPYQELTECCGCEITPDGLLTLSIYDDLTANPLTGHFLTSGVIKILGATLSSSPASNTPLPGLRAWATHVRPISGVLTETAFSDATLSAGELKGLEQACSFIYHEGSGAGICGCGNTEAGALFNKQ